MRRTGEADDVERHLAEASHDVDARRVRIALVGYLLHPNVSELVDGVRRCVMHCDIMWTDLNCLLHEYLGELSNLGGSERGILA